MQGSRIRIDLSLKAEGLRAFVLALALVLGAGSGCSAPDRNPATGSGKAAIYDSVNQALTKEECQNAMNMIDTVYTSQYTDNTARLLRASAYGCYVGINFFSLVTDLMESDLAGAGFWMSMTRLFPSEDADGKVEAAWQSTDALMAAMRTTSIVSPDNLVNVGTANPGSLFAGDRVDDSNLFLIFVSMATIGTIQNRYGAPAETYKKTQDLPWTNHEEVDLYGCSYVAGILNMLDSFAAFSASSSRFQSALEPINQIKEGMDLACEQGCQLCTLLTGVTLEDCTPCPRSMRNRAACSGSTAAAPTREACAAAGVVTFINSGGSLGWPTEGS